jgi:uncharacterized protein (TIGR03435 family)
MKIRQLFLLFFLAFCPYAYAQTSLIGTKVPNLIFQKVLNDKDTTYKLSDFADKVVIIDFWATWCPPCIDALPTLEALQKEFPNDVKLITVTSDNEARILKFLTKIKTGLPIALDSNEELAKIFPHRSISHTIIIDKKGIIKAVTTPLSINKDILQKVIKGETINIEEKIDNLTFDVGVNSLSATPNVLNQITLTAFRKGLNSVSTGFKNGRITFINLLPSSMYEVLYGYPFLSRSFWEVDKSKYAWAEENIYCLEIIAPNKTEKEAKELLINYLQSNIALKARFEEKETKVKILRRKGEHLNLTLSNSNEKSSHSSNRNRLDMQNSLIQVLANYIEGRLNKPVIDETGLTERYNLQLNWANENRNQIYEELNKLGLELIDGNKKIKMLVFYE